MIIPAGKNAVLDRVIRREAEALQVEFRLGFLADDIGTHPVFANVIETMLRDLSRRASRDAATHRIVTLLHECHGFDATLDQTAPRFYACDDYSDRTWRLTGRSWSFMFWHERDTCWAVEHAHVHNASGTRARHVEGIDKLRGDDHPDAWHEAVIAVLLTIAQP